MRQFFRNLDTRLKMFVTLNATARVLPLGLDAAVTFFL